MQILEQICVMKVMSPCTDLWGLMGELQQLSLFYDLMANSLIPE